MNRVSYLRGAGLIAAAEAFARVKGLVLIPLLAHAFGQVNYGVWSQVVVLVTLVPLFLLFGTDSAIVRFLPGADFAEQRRRFWGWTVAVLVAGGLIAIALTVAREPVAQAFFGGGDEEARFIPLAAIAIWVNMLLGALRTWLRVQHDSPRYAAVTAGQAAANLVAIAGVVIAGASLYTLVAATVAADAFVTALVLVVVAVRYGVSRPRFGGMGQLLRFGLPLAPAGFALWGINWIDRIFLVQIDDLATVGRYSLAYSLGYLAIQLVANPLWAMYPPVAAEHWNLGRRDRVAEQFRSTAGLTLVLVAPLIAASAVVGDQVIRIVAPASFADAAVVVPLVMGGYLAMMLSAYYETMCGLDGRPSLSTAAVGIGVVVNVALCAALIAPFSYTGAAIATLVAFLAQLAFSVWVVRRRRLFTTPFGAVARVLAAAATAGLATWACRSAAGLDGELWAIPLTLLTLGVYGLLCIVLGLVDVARARATLATLKRWSPRRATASAG